MSVPTSSSPVWLVTGVSSGFGTLIAQLALDAGHRVIGTVRSKTKSAAVIAPLEERGLRVVEFDYTATQDAIVQTVARDILPVFENHVDILVNNGAYAALGPLERYAEDEILTQMRTNVFGPLFLTQAILPQMRARRTGTIVNMSSFAAQKGVPAAALYNMSKFALEGWTEALATEVAEFGITVLVPEFGHFRTSFLNGDAFVRPRRGVVEGYEGSAAEKGFDMFGPFGGNQPGSPEKGVRKLIKWILDGGVVKGEKMQRVVVGEDAIQLIGTKVADLTRMLEVSAQWEKEEPTAI